MSKEITIYDIAKELNLSPATISRGLKSSPNISKETVRKILDKAEQMGYRHNNFASNLRRQNSNTIGVMVHELNSNFITSVLAGIEQVTNLAGYDLLIAHSSESFAKERSNASNLFHKRVDGLIASLSFDTTDLEHFKVFEEKNIPLIFFDRVEEKSDQTKVVIDNYKSGYLATKHLLEQGCKNIVMMTGSLNRNVYFQRHKGYKDALHEHGIAYNDKLVFIKDLSEAEGIATAKNILRMKHLPDGAFITNDFSAAVCMKVLKEHGIRIPEDIAIVGFNNDSIGKIVEPQLTTIDYPGIEVGKITATTLINHLKGISDLKTMQTIVVRSELLIRGSSLKKGNGGLF